VEGDNLAAASEADVAGDVNENAATQAPEGREGDGTPRAPRERRSRDRYGRDRRERSPRDASDAAQDSTSSPEFVTPAVSAQDEGDHEAPVRSSYFSMPAEAAPAATASTTVQPAADGTAKPHAAVTADVQPAAAQVAPAVEPRVVEDAPAMAPAAVKAPAPAPAPATAPASARLPTVPAFTLSIESLQQVAQASGLEWVNSNPEKVAQAQAAIAAEPKPIHVPREPRPVVVVDEGPLVLVETRKDLRNMTLPFENN